MARLNAAKSTELPLESWMVPSVGFYIRKRKAIQNWFILPKSLFFRCRRHRINNGLWQLVKAIYEPTVGTPNAMARQAEHSGKNETVRHFRLTSDKTKFVSNQRGHRLG
jgi:hypothetical protein